jgi:hypothetical protein
VPKIQLKTNKKNKTRFKRKEQRGNQRHLWSGGTGLSGVHRTVSGAPPDSVQCTRGLQLELATFGNFSGQRAIIHRTVRCTPDSVRCSKEARPPELASLGNGRQPLRYNSPDCPVCQRSNGHLRATVDSAKCAVEFRVSEQKSEGHRTVRCCTGLSGAT